MKPAAAWVMALNAALFVFGATQHAGLVLGRFSEPRIIPAAVVEILCAIALAWGAVVLFRNTETAARAAVIGNLIAALGVAIGMVALAAGAGPRTASNDFYHRVMLVLISAALLFLFADNRSRSRAR